MSKPSAPFKFRGKWRIQVTLKNGKRPAKDFTKHAGAAAWAADQLATANSQHNPELGGPKQAISPSAMQLELYQSILAMPWKELQARVNSSDRKRFKL